MTLAEIGHKVRRRGFDLDNVLASRKHKYDIWPRVLNLLVVIGAVNLDLCGARAYNGNRSRIALVRDLQACL